MVDNSENTETTQTPGPDPEPQRTGVNTDALKDARTWRRAVGPERKVAGVSAGIGRALNIDPTIVRVLFVVLAFANGLGIVLYAIGWLLIPEEGTDQPLIKSSDAARNTVLAIGAVLAGLAILGAFSAIAIGSGHIFSPWPMIPIALVLIAVIWLSQRSQNRAGYPKGEVMTTSADSNVSAGSNLDSPETSGYGDGSTPPVPAPPTPRPPRPDRGPVLFGFTLALLAVALGVLGLVDSTGTSVPNSAYPALGLAIIGVMLVVGSVVGRPGGLIALGVVFALGLAATAAQGPNWDGQHDINAVPTTAAAVDQSYEIGAGSILLDLSDVADPAALDGRTINLSVNFGEVLIKVPDDVGVNVNADVRYGGSIQMPDRSNDGWGVHVDRVINPEADTRITLNITVRFGQIEVRHS